MRDIKKLIVVTLVMVVGSTALVAPAGAYEPAPDITSNRERLKERLGAQTRLTEKRLEICQSREQRINALLQAGATRAKRQLAVFQKVEAKVQAFYTNKNLSVEGYDSAVVNVHQKEAAALAAAEKAATVSFDCQSVDSIRPGTALKQAIQARHTALKEYRTAIKNLILVVKKANGQHREDSPAQRKEEQ